MRDVTHMSPMLSVRSQLPELVQTRVKRHVLPLVLSSSLVPNSDVYRVPCAVRRVPGRDERGVRYDTNGVLSSRDYNSREQ